MKKQNKTQKKKKKTQKNENAKERKKTENTKKRRHIISRTKTHIIKNEDAKEIRSKFLENHVNLAVASTVPNLNSCSVI